MRRSFGLCLLVALILTGCTVAPKAKPASNLTGTVRVLVIGGSGLESTLFTAFTSANPNVKPESVMLGDTDDFGTTVAKIKSGELKVDAIVAPANSFLFAQGAVAPLDDMVKSQKLSLTEYGNTLALGKYQGKLMGLPVSVSPMVVVYNQDLLDKAGIKAPAAGWTWDEFQKDAQALVKAQEGNAKGFAVAIPAMVMVDMVLTAGKGPTDPDLKPLQSTLELLHNLQADPKVMMPADKYPSPVDYFLAFSRGEIGMMLTYWENSFGHSAKPQSNWNVAPMPGGALTPGVPTLAMITTSAENKANAEAFVKFAASSSGAQAVVTMPGAPVPAYVDQGITAQWMAHAGLKGDSTFMLSLKYLPTLEYPEALATPLLMEADAVLAGKKSPADAVKAYEEARKPLMSK